MKRFVILLCTALLSSAIFAADGVVEIKDKVYWICKNHKDVRTIRVHTAKDGACTTFYSKSGVEKNVGSGKNFDSCVSFLERIRTNLEKSSWNCRDITSTQISSAE